MGFEPGTSHLPGPFPFGTLCRVRLPPSGLLALRLCLSARGGRHYRLSSTPSPPPTDDRERCRVRLPREPPVHRSDACFRQKRRGLGRCPFHSPCPPGPQGFTLHSVARFLRPCLISTTRESATLCPLPASGSPYRVRFSTAADSRPQQVRRASLGKTHRLPRYRPAPRRAGPPDIRSRSSRPARPPPQRHVAGSLFATYPGSASCFLQTRHL